MSGMSTSHTSLELTNAFADARTPDKRGHNDRNVLWVQSLACRPTKVYVVDALVGKFWRNGVELKIV